MFQGGGVDDNLSNLTSAISNEASMSSSTNITDQMGGSTNPRQQYNPIQPPPKKRRNLPGNPDPEAEVVALSPHALMATNRFVCEICNKGFQRDQNLQLHRRGHNLPWKLKQRNKLEVIRKKVYVCPEPGCVHHDPARALGDLTGIKKHFSRKHGEKKWKCEKCSKRYAVQSDWKAHSKICGTREYRCDCGTLFSRRDSFITHRAFCDALAEESSRSMTTQNPLLSSSQTAPNQIHGFHIPLIPLKQESQSFTLPPWLEQQTPGAGGTAHQINPIFTSIQENPNPNNIPSNFSSSCSSLMSATALLQKAAQMGVTMSAKTPYQHVGAPEFCATSSANTTPGMPPRDDIGTGFLHGWGSYGNNKLVNLNPNCTDLQDMNNMVGGSSMPSTSGFDASLAFDQDSFNGILNPKRNLTSFQQDAHFMGLRKEGGGGGDGMTRDFLGLRAFPNGDFSNMAGFDQMGSSSYDQNQAPWQS